jgi:RND family efflux transporter MFP subunit
MSDGPGQRGELLDRLKIDRSQPEPSGNGLGMGLAGLAVGVVLTAGAAWLMWPSAAPLPETATAAPSTPAQSASSTATAPAAPAAGGAVLSASGYVTARRLATVSAEIIGKVSEILVEEGTPVEAGQVLARLDASLATLDRDMAKAARDAAKAELDNAKATLRRLEGLPRGVASVADLTRARTAAAAADARLEQAGATLGRSEAVLARYEIKAPFAGVITSKDAQPGEIVSPSAAGGGSTRTGICTLVDMASLEIEVDVSESYISRVTAGQKAEAALDAYPDWQIPAHVIAIIPTASRDKATVKVRIAIDARDQRILPNMAAKVRFLDSGAKTP